MKKNTFRLGLIYSLAVGSLGSTSAHASQDDFFICDRIVRNVGVTAVQRGQRAQHFNEIVAFVFPDAHAPTIIGSAHVPGEGMGYRDVRLGVYSSDDKVVLDFVAGKLFFSATTGDLRGTVVNLDMNTNRLTIKTISGFTVSPSGKKLGTLELGCYRGHREQDMDPAIKRFWKRVKAGQ